MQEQDWGLDLDLNDGWLDITSDEGVFYGTV